MIGRILDKLTGEEVYFEKVCNKIYNGDNNTVVKECKRENSKRFRWLVSIFGVVFILNLISILIPGESNLITEGGFVEAINRPDEGDYEVTLLVKIDDKKVAFTREVPLKINSEVDKRGMENQTGKASGPDNAKEVQENKLLNIIRQIDKNEASIVVLPKELEEGVELRWCKKNNDNFVYLFLLFALCIVILYVGRFSGIKKKEREAKSSVLMELPDFINKIVLLLNAGLVFSSAFSTVVEKDKEQQRNTYFSNQMINIKDRVSETNSSLIMELKNFSARIQIRELVRTVNIISDNAYKGSLLVEKLQIESDLLWENRRKFAEETIRIGETKLSFPLAIHLIVLISITIAPALITT